MTNLAPRMVAGRYRLSGVLGRGTMGTVWSAHDELLGRPVAVKEVLLPPGIPDAEADALRERTLREARAIAALSHPNVVTLYDVVWEGAAPFVVMELVASHSLAELLQEGRLPSEQVTAVGAAVAAALQAAHAAGITHRDVKPGNVLMAHDGRIKLTDFGIARNPADQTLTGTGLMLGSPAYIAPEIASGGPVNPAADLWGLGATLFSAVEGRPPYDAGTAMATVASVVQDEVPQPSCSGPLAEAISGLMVKDPERRMSLSQVRHLLGAHPQPADPQPAPRAATAAARTPRSNQKSTQHAPETPRRRTGQLAADPGPLPFAVTSDAVTSDAGASDAGASDAGAPVPVRRVDRTNARPRLVLWMLAVLVFLGTAAAGFGVARVAVDEPVLPSLGARAAQGTGPNNDVVLTPRVLQLTEPDGSRPARFTVSVPRGWPEFRERRVLGSTSGTVLRFVSPDGSEVITVERVTGVSPGGAPIVGSADGGPIAGSADGGPIAGSADGGPGRYLSSYLGKLAQSVPELVETQRQKMSAGALDAAFRTQEGSQLRRTTYLRLIPVGADLWVVSATVPTEREGAGRTKLFEPVVAGFTPAI